MQHSALTQPNIYQSLLPQMLMYWNLQGTDELVSSTKFELFRQFTECSTKYMRKLCPEKKINRFLLSLKKNQNYHKIKSVKLW